MFPGKCEAAPQAPASGTELFVYARSLKVHAGDVQNFTGAERFCIRNDTNFDINGRRECRMRGYVAADFSPAEYSVRRTRFSFLSPIILTENRRKLRARKDYYPILVMKLVLLTDLPDVAHGLAKRFSK